MHWIKGWPLLRSLGLEFWLPLPLIGLAFWIASAVITDYSLKSSGPSVEPFTIALDKNQSSKEILSIKVNINRNLGSSQVKVKQAAQVYQKQEFELKTTNLEQIEAEISQKLELSSEKVRQLLRYQIRE